MKLSVFTSLYIPLGEYLSVSVFGEFISYVIEMYT